MPIGCRIIPNSASEIVVGVLSVKTVAPSLPPQEEEWGKGLSYGTNLSNVAAWMATRDEDTPGISPMPQSA